jgi:polysaccharide deacetylase 2 family uncharacterized protein YibQ
MTTDVEGDLHTPLMPRARFGENWPVWRAKILWAVGWFTRVGGAVLGVALLLLTGWVFLTDTPLGGEPQTQSQIQIAGSPNAAGGRLGGDQTPGLGETDDGLAQPLPSQPEPIAGGPRVLQVPQADALDPGAQDASELPPINAAANAPRFDSRGGLSAVANPSLVERFDSSSFVPSLGSNGERALDAYARPLEAGTIMPGQPRIALIVGGLGISQTSTQEVINSLPGATTLSFAPYGSSLTRWASRARQDGHEYLIEVPMEPFDYPNNDPGPHTLQVGLTEQANLERLHWALSRLPTPIGFMNYMGGRFASEEAALAPIINDAVGRGLMVVDDGRSARSRVTAVAGANMPVLRADVVIDARADQQSINNRLAQLEAIARERGSAVGVATALPLTITTLEEWTASLASKGIALVPVSSIVRF